MYSTESPLGAAALLDRPRGTMAPIVVATDGSEASESALVFAQQMTQASRGKVDVVAIHESMPVPVFEFSAFPALLEAEEARREALRRQVAAQVRRVAGEEHADWTILIRDGDPATELARIATDLEARAVILGVKHRHLTDRVFGRETALRLMQESRVPLLMVPTGFAHQPRRVVFAIDFSAPSLEAARLALGFFDTIAHVTLLHVTSSPVPPPTLYGSWREWFDEDTARIFAWARSELAMPSSIELETLSLEGHAAREIVHVARDKGADLIVTGTRGAGLIDRLLSGSTARGVVHAAECAVLVVPPRESSVAAPPKAQASP